ncbi:nuclear transport factor 2 family protein [Zeaxanthinibacter sp. PT1]|uniref:nuclear transport factor 2 family protein n=1 Tax=Zeaxanthinibacter TaxID=561554 RepID=UPI00234B0A6F|nr:nuclear transport factor 2 family protein [Zeaxanthinibacter sp. PT1]MDC6350086.1 nuclear transport factor 2 family protein [Zeaxanthinibacter sp. PT1]
MAKNLILKSTISGMVIAAILMISCNKQKHSDAPIVTDTRKSENRAPVYTPSNQALFDTITKLDSIFWLAWNEGDLKIIEELTSDDHEFYHDSGGAFIMSKEEHMKDWESFFKNRRPQRGSTYKGYTEVYEIPDFGALQVGYQQFFDKKYPEGSPPSRLVTLWEATKEGWKQKYVISTHADE